MNLILQKGIRWSLGGVMVALLALRGGYAAEKTPKNTLSGTWHCYFLNPKNAIEKEYYSSWTFDDQKRLIGIFYSPVHKGFTYSYRWNGEQLALGYPNDFDRLSYGTYKTQRPSATALIIEDPKMPWKGWRCQPRSGEDWPPDGLKFLDYARYPWLSKLIEDGPSLLEYRNPARYREWLKSIESRQ